MPGPPGSGLCVQVCPAGYKIARDELGFNSCLRDGNFKIKVHHRKYAFLTLAAGQHVDGICFGIRDDERTIDSVVDDRFIDWQWHTKDGHIWVAEVSYTLDSALTRLRLTGVRSWRVDQHGKPVGVSEFMPGPAEVLLYDAPQPVWPCTAQQWAAIMEPPHITAVPPGYGSGPSWALKGGWAPPNPLATRCGVGSLTYYTMSGHC